MGDNVSVAVEYFFHLWVWNCCSFSSVAQCLQYGPHPVGVPQLGAWITWQASHNFFLKMAMAAGYWCRGCCPCPFLAIRLMRSKAATNCSPFSPDVSFVTKLGFVGVMVKVVNGLLEASLSFLTPWCHHHHNNSTSKAFGRHSAFCPIPFCNLLAAIEKQ